MEKEIFSRGDQGDQVEFHLLPCRVEYEGESQFKKFFVIKDNQSTLRGRGLKGKNLDLEAGLIRKVAEKWRLEKKSSRTMIWSHDQQPSKETCSILNAKAWIQLSKAIHSD
jgi:hypothetical protein